MLRFIIFILLFNTICLAEKHKDSEKTISNKGDLPNIESTEQKIKSSIQDSTNTVQEQKPNITNKLTDENKNKTNVEQHEKSDESILNSFKINNEEHSKDPWAAAVRGFYVFLGLSIIIIIYFVVKSFRLRPGAAPPATIRKYGVVGRRSDMEMLPLPLVEEDDDDTVFDMGTQITR